MTSKDFARRLLNTTYGKYGQYGLASSPVAYCDTDVPLGDPYLKWVNITSARDSVNDDLNELLEDRLKWLKENFETKPNNNTETKKENNMSNTIKNVLFLAPGYQYAKTVVTNQSKELDRKKIPYNASTEPNNFFIHTERVHIEIVYMDPIKWTTTLFQKRDAVFGKKELIDKAREHYFHYFVAPTKSLSKYIRDIHAEEFREETVKPREIYIPEIKNAYFNDPMTVVIWEDGTKTMVRCQDGDEYSAETGLALCIAKKALGNMPNFNNVFKKWIPETTGPKNHYTLEVEGVDFAKAMKEGDFLSRFRDSIQRAFGLDEV